MIHARFAGIGSYLPEKIVTNKDLEKIMATSDEWIQERTGIKCRHIASDDEKTSTLGLKAAKRAMINANVGPEDIDLIIVATTTPDQIFPSTACLIQHQLGIKGCAAFDIQAVCSGFVYALDVANRFIQTKGATTALVIGAETLSRILDWKDRSTAVLFGDGAGCVVLKAGDKAGIISSHSHADGQYADLLQVRSGISAGFDEDKSGGAFIEMNGNAVFKRAVATFDKIAREAVVDIDGGLSGIDWFIPHQANMRIIKAAAKKLEMPMERVIATVDKHANTSGASIPLALDYAFTEGFIKAGDTLLLAAFGGGFTWGSTLIKY